VLGGLRKLVEAGDPARERGHPQHRDAHRAASQHAQARDVCEQVEPPSVA
jgi:hypothetical protein